MRKKKLLKMAMVEHRVGGAARHSSPAKAAAAVSPKRKAAFGRIYSSDAFSAEAAYKAFEHIVVD